MNSALNIIGSQKHNGNQNSTALWELQELENAFYFFIPDNPDAEPLFVEFDELTAAGSAYVDRGPLNMLDMLTKLEEISPGFAGIKISENMKLTRQRWSRSAGLSLEIDGKTVSFLKEATLETVNFFDFYQNITEIKN